MTRRPSIRAARAHRACACVLQFRNCRNRPLPPTSNVRRSGWLTSLCSRPVRGKFLLMSGMRPLGMLVAVWMALLAANSSPCSADQRDFYSFRYDDETIYHYAVGQAQQIGPHQYVVIRLSTDGNERLRFRHNTIGQLYRFCGKKDGTYRSPTELLIFGSPDFQDQGIAVGNGTVSWPIPYRKFTDPYLLELQTTDHETIVCQLTRADGAVLSAEESKRITLYSIYEEKRRSFETYDCEYKLSGYRLDGLMRWQPIHSHSMGQYILHQICQRIATRSTR